MKGLLFLLSVVGVVFVGDSSYIVEAASSTTTTMTEPVTSMMESSVPVTTMTVPVTTIAESSPTMMESTSTDGTYTEVKAMGFSEEMDDDYNIQCNLEMVARWNYITDLNNAEAEQTSIDASINYFNFQSDEAATVKKYDWEIFNDVSLYRKFRFQKDKGPGGLNEDDLTRYNQLQSSMETLYSTATICDYYNRTKCDLLLEPDLENIMATSTDYDELWYVWQQWREVAGKPIRDDYLSFVELSNQAAINDNYADTGIYWLDGYTVTQEEVAGYNQGPELSVITAEDFKNLTENLFNDVLEQLYKPLHAFVRMKLKQTSFYGDYINSTGTLPAHILGNMWAQDWTNIAEHVMPFPSQPDFDVTQSMIDNNWDIDRMFKASEEFFVSLGLPKMTQDFWDKSVVDQEAWGKAMVCHASAEDFCSGPGNTDFRIKMCTQVDMTDLITVHHEMGHIEYFMAYTNLSHVFRTSANPGFHEAIGDLIALSVSTPDHMESVLNLTSSSPSTNAAPSASYNVTEQQDLNFLMRMALEKIAFLPFGYLIDKYRWQIFDKTTTTANLNADWWALREEYQGVSPPLGLRRGESYTDANNFDAGAKYHVPANVPYIRYFVSYIVQFQFHQKLCKTAGFEGDLHKCDIYNNKKAGSLLLDTLKEGFSQPWPIILNQLGDSADMSADAIISYFDPLMKYINAELEANKQVTGWTTHQEMNDNDAADELLTYIDGSLQELAVDSVFKSWDYNTNVNDDTLAAMNEASATFSAKYNELWTDDLMPFDYSRVTDPFLRRQFVIQQSIGTSILSTEDLNDFNAVVGSMTNTLNNKVCPYYNQNCDAATDESAYDINYLEIEMGTNKDYDQLSYYWQQWRDVSGREVLPDFPSYVNLTNKAATENGFDDGSQMWLEPYAEDFYTSDNFKTDIENIWIALQPFYEQLHGYVRWKLQNNADYGYDQYFTSDGLIPANILGNMYAQSWVNIYDIVVPYPDTELTDLTPTLEDEIGNVREMFDMAEEFFVGIDLFPMSSDFKDNTLYEQPDDRIVICHASAWDFYSLVDDAIDGNYRIKMCTNKTQEDFLTIHHEMGHIEYYMSYSQDMPLIFRDGANNGFHEAIGDTIALSVTTPSHIDGITEDLTGSSSPNRRVALPATEQEKQDINFLMKQALDKVAFLPYAYILDLWRWDAFNGNITEDMYNYDWWDKRIDYQGVKPPVTRSLTFDFDIGCKYHVPTNVPYIRYFVATILQFQFHERLCEIIEYPGDIYNCDIDGKKPAGQALKAMLTKGRSQNWQRTLADFLGDPNGQMSADAILSYFTPLINYLNQTINDNDIEIGWDHDAVNDFIMSELDEEVLDGLENMEESLTVPGQNAVLMTWNYDVDETEDNLALMNTATQNFSSLYNEWWQEVIDPVNVSAITNADAKRQVEMQKSIGIAILEPEKMAEFNDVVGYMANTMNEQICIFKNLECDESTEGTLGIDELEVLMGTERDYTTLMYYWERWRQESGEKYIENYTDYTSLVNLAAEGNDFESGKEMWINKYTWEDYGTQDFTDDVERLMDDLTPFYVLLQAYVREKLKDYDDYGQFFEDDNLIPAHILGNMYGQSWINIYDIVVPYPDVPITNITDVLVKEINNVTEMFEIAEGFFTSINLYPMTEDFKLNTMYEQPEGKIVVCHASAMDFRSTETNNTIEGKFRIKMCTDKNEEDFITIHHEMGHIEYFMSYSDGKPFIYRNGANPGFHEAIGDTIALSVSTPSHLQGIINYLQSNKTESNGRRIIPKVTEPTSDEETINFLMKQALDKIAFLPYAYILDEWRWDVFRKNITRDTYNSEWWGRRIDYQGVRPPVKRTGDHFDIGCKYHVAANVPYIRYFIATILEFQFHQKLCEITNQSDPLYECDIYNQTVAGDALKKLLSKGASEPWQDQLREFLDGTDNGTMSSKAILNYFEPLIVYLQDYIDENGIETGWETGPDVLNDYMTNGSDIGAVVPIVVGVVLAVLVIIVVVAFFVGQRKRKKADELAKRDGKDNEAMEMEGKDDI